MNEKDKQAIIAKIMNFENDPKGSRVAVTIFINRGNKEEGKYFLQYLESGDQIKRKIARQIVGNLGILEALEVLIKEFMEITAGMTFLPDEEIKEKVFFANLIEIIETVFLIYKSTGKKNDDLLAKIDEIFIRTKSEDLRFSLIKLLGVLGDRLQLFLKLYPDLTIKERRALYYVYSFIDHPGKAKIYELGLGDRDNFEFAVSNALMSAEGKDIIKQKLMDLSVTDQQVVLTKLLDNKYPDFQDALTKLLEIENKYIVELAADNLKNSIKLPFPLERFKSILNTGYSPYMVESGIKLINHFVKKNVENIYLEALNTQKIYKNKIIILESLFNKLKSEKKITEKFSQKIIQPFMDYFQNYNPKKDEFLISILKILPLLVFSKSITYKNIRRHIVNFGKQNERQLTKVLRNNLNESITRINALISRIEKGEEKIGNITVLFDLPPESIDINRFDKLKLQLQDLDYFEEKFIENLTSFLMKIHDMPKQDWKIRAAVLKIMGDYANGTIVPRLKEIVKTETSLGVRVSAEDALKKIIERYDIEEESVLILIPIFYINKLVTEYFTAKGFQIINVKDIDQLTELNSKNISYVFISDVFIKDDQMDQILDMIPEMEEDPQIIITTPKPDEIQYKADGIELTLLKIPFKPENLDSLLSS